MSFTMRNLFDYDQDTAPHYTLSKHLRYWGVDVDHRIEGAMNDFFRGKLVLEFKPRPKPRISPLWRLTFPAWVLFWLLLILIICPVLWLLTGNYALHAKHPVYLFFKPWHRKLFP